MSEIEKMVSDLEQFDDSEVYTLRNGHIAVSPFDDYPGEIIFPVKFTGKLYKAYLDGQKQAQKNELDVYSAWWWSFLAVSPIVNVTGMSLDFDENNIELNRWGVAMLMRWAAPFLTSSPWQKPSGNGADTKDRPPG
jgi:hypothetical protein